MAVEEEEDGKAVEEEEKESGMDRLGNCGARGWERNRRSIGEGRDENRIIRIERSSKDFEKNKKNKEEMVEEESLRTFERDDETYPESGWIDRAEKACTAPSLWLAELTRMMARRQGTR